MQRKRTRAARKAFYQIKRAYGFQVTLCRPQSSSFDFETGVEENITTFKIIKRAVMLPSSLETEKKIRYNERSILLDWQDIKIIGVEINDIILFNDQSWRVSEVENYELKTIKRVKIKHIVGATYINPLEPDASSVLSVSQGVVNA